MIATGVDAASITQEAPLLDICENDEEEDAPFSRPFAKEEDDADADERWMDEGEDEGGQFARPFVMSTRAEGDGESQDKRDAEAMREGIRSQWRREGG